MKRSTMLSLTLAIAVAVFAAQAWASPEHAVTGVVSKVDKDAKTITVKAADGTEHVLKYTDKTAVHGSKDAAKEVKTGSLDSYMAGKEGSHVVVRYTGEAAGATATRVDEYGKDGLKTTEGTVTKLDKGAHTVTVKTSDGAEQTFNVTKDDTLHAEHGTVEGAEHALKSGDKVVIHYSEDGEKKVARLWHKL